MTRTVTFENRRTRNGDVSVSGMHNRAEGKEWAPGEFLTAVASAARAPETIDARLMRDFTDGKGIAEVPVYLADRFSYRSDSPILSHVTNVTIKGNSARIIFPDETQQSEGALTFSSVPESGQYTASVPPTRLDDVPMGKAGAALYTTAEWIDDAVNGEALIMRQAMEGLRSLLENGIMNNPGLAGPLGIFQSPANIVEAIEGSQTIANTAAYIALNIGKMAKRIRHPSRARLYLQQEFVSNLIAATTGGTAHPIFGPATEAAPHGTICTFPFFYNEFAPSVGSVGDILLADLSDYYLITKGGLRTAMSVHVRFLNDENVFRFSIRYNGQPATSGPITTHTGALTKSPYVTLAARS